MLRMVSAADAAGIRAIYRPYVEGTAISFESVVPTIEEVLGRIASTVVRHPWLVAVEGDDVLGYAYGHSFAPRDGYRWSVETSVYVRSERRGAGTGRRLYTTLLDLLEAQGYREAFAGITLPNEASVALHEAMQFRPVAHFRRAGWKLGSWHDVGWWQRHLCDDEDDDEDGDGTPSEPMPPAQLDPTTVEALLRR